jgi:hypothetical protein
VIDGNNVYGSRPDGWWNDRDRAAARFAQEVAVWCRTHDDHVTLVFDPPVSTDTLQLAGGNLTIEVAPHRRRDAADDHIVGLIAASDQAGVTVVTSDRGLRTRLDDRVVVVGAGRFLALLAS